MIRKTFAISRRSLGWLLAVQLLLTCVLIYEVSHNHKSAVRDRKSQTNLIILSQKLLNRNARLNIINHDLLRQICDNTKGCANAEKRSSAQS